MEHVGLHGVRKRNSGKTSAKLHTFLVLAVRPLVGPLRRGHRGRLVDLRGE